MPPNAHAPGRRPVNVLPQQVAVVGRHDVVPQSRDGPGPGFLFRAADVEIDACRIAGPRVGQRVPIEPAPEQMGVADRKRVGLEPRFDRKRAGRIDRLHRSTVDVVIRAVKPQGPPISELDPLGPVDAAVVAVTRPVRQHLARALVEVVRGDEPGVGGARAAGDTQHDHDCHGGGHD